MKPLLFKKISLLLVAGVAFAQVGVLGCTGAGKALETADSNTTNLIQGDYGDAPDQLSSKYPSGIIAKFPSRFSSNGARHLDLGDAAFGPFQADGVTLSVSSETDATDPADSDGIQNIDSPIGDSDHDGKDDGLLSSSLSTGGTSSITFAVSASAMSAKKTRYVNMLIDWNQNGEWKGSDSNGADEWIVKNMSVDVEPGKTAIFKTPDFMAGLTVSPVWLRMTLSDTPIDASAYPNGWDGTGFFKQGETEDYYLNDHSAWPLPDKNALPGGGPLPPFPPPVGGGGGGGGGGGNCEFWKTYTVTLCKGSSTTRLALVGGFAPDKVTASSDDPSTASVEVNEANVTITGNAEGTTTINVDVYEDGCVWHLTIIVKVKKCGPKPKIDCCTPAEIAKDPSRCKNCHVVGWKVYTNETPGGGGSSADGGITETGSHGDTSDASHTKSTVVMVGNVIKIVVTYYKCDPCPEPGAAKDGDGDGDKIPDETDDHPKTPYNPAQPGCYQEQLNVDSFFDINFDSNNDHGIYDYRSFTEGQEQQINWGLLGFGY